MPCTWEDLEAVRQQWQETFGEQMPFGFEIGYDDIPLLRRCIAEKSMKPLDDHIEDLLKDGRDY